MSYTSYKVDRVVQSLDGKGWAFGHYDSRGGCCIIMAASMVDAMKAYAIQFHGMDGISFEEGLEQLGNDEDTWFNFCADELMTPVVGIDVIICDRPADVMKGVDMEYSEPGYNYGLLTMVDGSGKHSTPLAVIFWQGDEPPAVEVAREKWDPWEHCTPHITKESWGEDAYGVYLLTSDRYKREYIKSVLAA